MNIVLDIGTSGIKAILFDTDHNIVHREYTPLSKKEEGVMVEQDPKEILDISLKMIRAVIKSAPSNADFVLGITTQRETVVAWDKETGAPLYNAISWQDERTRVQAQTIQESHGSFVRDRTGLSVLPYFSATKMHHLLDKDLIKESFAEDTLMMGTLDAWVVWNMTGNFYTDVTNASRTLLYDIYKNKWSKELSDIFSVPTKILPDVLPSKSDFGSVDIDGVSIPLKVVSGDQQSSLYAADDFRGGTKITFGSGVFIMQVIDKNDIGSVENDYFITRTCGEEYLYCIEKKVRRLAEYVTPLLERDNLEELHRLIDTVVSEIVPFVEELPIKPDRIMVDGGVTKSDYLVAQLKQKIPSSIVKQKYTDGTALGVSMLLG